MANKWKDLAAPLMEDPERAARIVEGSEQLRRENFAHRLADLRKEQGLDQTELADRLGITQSAVSRIENAADTKLSTIQRYVGALGGTLHMSVEVDDNAH